LDSNYSGVIYAYGADKEWDMDNLGGYANILQSKRLINWYNSHPSYEGYGKQHIRNWDKIEDVVVVG